jgi:hypothetical protein
MTNQKTTSQIRQTLGLKAANSKRSKLDWTFVTGLADLLGYDANRAIYGLQWAVGTGRLTATAEMTIRRMNAWQFSRLVGEVIDSGISQNDTPRWLNGKYN